ncbi:YopX family protein [Streptococcus parasanguinis]|uniref:YopX family protein n=1 Tax=Streptococcus parasanguinis TaxID=1318 RepID=UPI001897F912|nr:YopX family protein [Streptococcus parasanguinis]
MIPKFRAWSTDKKIMAEVRTLRFTDELVETDKFVERSIEGVELMQSTGLLDKNGKEIFEGDIITNGQNVMCMKKRNTLGFYIEEKEKVEFIADCADLEEFEADAKEVADNIEIIGNIYKNPELLEVTE